MIGDVQLNTDGNMQSAFRIRLYELAGTHVRFFSFLLLSVESPTELLKNSMWTRAGGTMNGRMKLALASKTQRDTVAGQDTAMRDQRPKFIVW